MTYTELRGRIDELERDLLEVRTAGVDNERLADGDDTLLCSGDGTLEHDVVVLDNTVVGEATHGCDGLLGNVAIGRRVGLIVTRTDAVDLLVDLRTVMVTVWRRRHD